MKNALCRLMIYKRIQHNIICSHKVIFVIQDIHQGQGKDAEHMKCQRYEKLEEVSVVTPSHTVVHPRTVMVKSLRRKISHKNIAICFCTVFLDNYYNKYLYLNAVVTDTAMWASRGTIKLTRGAPFHTDGDSIDVYVFVKWCTEIVILVFIFMGCLTKVFGRRIA